MAMKVSYKSLDGRTLISFESPDVKTFVKQMSQLQLVIEHTKCQACIDKGDDPDKFGSALDFRVAKGYPFYAVVCQNPECGARLEFGQRKDESGGGLFVKRRDQEGKDIEHRGWTWYRGEGAATQPAQPAERTVTHEHEPAREDDIPF